MQNNINDFIIHPIFSSFISIFFLLGIFGIAYSIAKKVTDNKANLTYISTSLFYFILVIISTIIFVLAQFSILPILVYKVIGYLIILWGVITALLFFRGSTDKISSFFVQTHKASNFILILKLLILSILLGFFISVLGPVTDADSIAYHLGVPVGIINNGGYFINSLWMDLRLIGSGEYLNLIGLLLGTDNINAHLQFFSLILFLLNLISINKFQTISKEDKNILLFILLIVSTPVLLFLIPSQKPQLSGTFALLTTVLFFVENERIKKYELYFLFPVFYAISLKYSFYIPSMVILIYGLIRFKKGNRVVTYILSAFFVYLISVFPYNMFNVLNYKDPLSPLLSFFFNKSQTNLITYANYIKNYSEGLKFPLGLLIPSSLGAVTTTLGIIVFTPVLINKPTKKGIHYLIIGLTIFILLTVFGQKTSRFYLGSFILFAVTVFNTLKFNKLYSLFRIGIIVQSCIAIFMIWSYSVFVIPALTSNSSRLKLMKHVASGTNIETILEKTVPCNSTLITDFRIHGLLRYNFIPYDYRFLLEKKSNTILNYIKKQGYNDKEIYLITNINLSSPHLLDTYFKRELILSKKILQETRNPFNRIRYNFFIYKLILL